MSWRLFMHSLRLVFANLGGALRVSGVLTIASYAVLLAFGRPLLADGDRLREAVVAGETSWGAILLVGLVQIVVWLWIVVGWHRYILLNEAPALVPAFRVDRMLGYLGKSALIMLILMPVALALGFVAVIAAFPLVQSGTSRTAGAVLIGLVILYLPLAVIGTRLGAVLPGVAIEGGVPLLAGWKATKGATFTILGVVLLAGLGGVVLDFIGRRVFADPFGPAALVYLMVVQWITAMVGAAILTTLYGYYVEKRPLP